MVLNSRKNFKKKLTSMIISDKVLNVALERCEILILTDFKKTIKKLLTSTKLNGKILNVAS